MKNLNPDYNMAKKNYAISGYYFLTLRVKTYEEVSLMNYSISPYHKKNNNSCYLLEVSKLFFLTKKKTEIDVFCQMKTRIVQFLCHSVFRTKHPPLYCALQGEGSWKAINVKG